MKPTARSVAVFVLLLSLLGTAALSLPFTTASFLFSELGSPWDIVRRVDNDFVVLVGQLLLVVPILVWKVRRLVADHLTTGEIIAAYGVATAGEGRLG